MKDDGVETESVEEGERESEIVELVGEDSTSDPDRRKTKERSASKMGKEEAR